MNVTEKGAVSPAVSVSKGRRGGTGADVMEGSKQMTTVDLGQTLREHFGFSEFLTGQREVIEYLLAGHSAAAVFPTGGGKSLCYQLPALVLPGVTVVVSPLIALMKDQIDALTARGIPAVRFDSTLNYDEYREAVERLRAGKLRLIYAAPERFNNERFRELMQQIRVSLFAIDEAHCISEWGHAFRPDYLKLAKFALESGAERTFALTATAPPRVLSDICEGLAIDPKHAVVTGFYRRNLHLRITPVTREDRDQTLMARIQEQPPAATIVYVTLRQTSLDVAQRLNQAGVTARPYHAGMKPEERTEIQEWFLASDDAIIVATIAFGMGIDKPNIRYVYHYNLPKSLEGYSQEIGRAGRDGESSTCEILACADDLRTLENFVYGDMPEIESVRAMVPDLFGRGEEISISLYELSNRHDIRDLVLKTLLTYLELDGYLEGGTPIYGEYRFKPLTNSAAILRNFEGERKEFVTALLKLSKKAHTWFTLDIDAAVKRLHADRGRIVRAMDYLSERGWVELQTSKVQSRYKRLRQPDDADELGDLLFDRCVERQEQELERLAQVIQLIELDSCHTNALSLHFGEERAEPCGHCQWCVTHSAVALDPPRSRSIDSQQWEQAVRVREEHPQVLRTPESFARFLAGVTTPKLTRAKLSRHPLFGALAEVPFDEIVQRAR